MYDFSKVDERNLLPDGDYEAVIVKTMLEEWGPSVQFEITGPKFAGYKMFDRYKIKVDDAGYREKQNKKLKRLLVSVNPFRDKFSSDDDLLNHLHDKKLIIKIKTFTKDDGANANFIGGYAPLLNQKESANVTNQVLKSMRESMGMDGLTPKVDPSMTTEDIPF